MSKPTEERLGVRGFLYWPKDAEIFSYDSYDSYSDNSENVINTAYYNFNI